MPNVTFWTYKKTSCFSCFQPPKASPTAPSPHQNSRALRADRACGPRPPVPNVTFWTYKKTSCLTQNGACATAKQQGPEGRTGPAGHFLNLYKKTSFLTQNGACATTKQQGPEGRTGPAGHGPQCLTSFSAPTRKLVAVWAVFQPPKASQTAPPPHQNSRALRDGPGLRATAPSA